MSTACGLVGKKLGMTQVFNPDGSLIGVTAIEVGPCVVVQKRTLEKDGYTALQLGFDEKPERKANRPETGHFKTVRGDRKCYVASDHVESSSYRVFTPESLLDIVSQHRLHYDHTSQSGIVLHMISDVGGSGHFGVTAIDDSHDKADALYCRFLEVIDREVRKRKAGDGR